MIKEIFDDLLNSNNDNLKELIRFSIVTSVITVIFIIYLGILITGAVILMHYYNWLTVAFNI